ncbi:thiolase-like protein [Gloeophyllum trabeum ATCC 11539]|uniref:Thiolase-like protein n=1 Tax=Gloeophyllum trabeum (strain ATCC 11539 / FP-39264 / Madison 617) TaxID=670483 RepID=S7RNZ1_GLOTA|nr:thiolase-like protein [Gloeophyllum trabeum ATCC 11539]EPQ56255.1 thiolase-like protein [Gloeophyllum trabeum ATCC 11539]
MTCPIVDIVVEELQARPRPKDVGMLAMEMHFLRRCISEEELEVFDGVSKGKYTIALGLQYMAFADDREDINPSALTAPIVFESIHGTYMTDTYDFYKPRLDFEYPEVDGPLSVTSYLTALDMSYSSFGEKTGPGRAVTHDDPDSTFSLDDTAYHVFHCPYGKIVQKGHARLLYNDLVADPSAPKSIDQSILNPPPPPRSQTKASKTCSGPSLRMSARLELYCRCTARSAAGTCTPRCGTAGSLL